MRSISRSRKVGSYVSRYASARTLQQRSPRQILQVESFCPLLPWPTQLFAKQRCAVPSSLSSIRNAATITIDSSPHSFSKPCYRSSVPLERCKPYVGKVQLIFLHQPFGIDAPNHDRLKRDTDFIVTEARFGAHKLSSARSNFGARRRRLGLGY